MWVRRGKSWRISIFYVPHEGCAETIRLLMFILFLYWGGKELYGVMRVEFGRGKDELWSMSSEFCNSCMSFGVK